MKLSTLSRSDVILLLTDVVEFRELIADVLTDLQDTGWIAFVTDDAGEQIHGVQASLMLQIG